MFSDDIPWCRESLELERAEFVDVDHGTSLAVMAGCDVNIIANSSFSWWGAYLNPASEVYAPSRWFGPEMSSAERSPGRHRAAVLAHDPRVRRRTARVAGYGRMTHLIVAGLASNSSNNPGPSSSDA